MHQCSFVFSVTIHFFYGNSHVEPYGAVIMTQIISEKQFDYPPYVETIPEST